MRHRRALIAAVFVIVAGAGALIARASMAGDAGDEWNPRVAQRQQLRFMAAKMLNYARRNGRPVFDLDSVVAHLDSAEAAAFRSYRKDLWGASVLYFWSEAGFQLKSDAGFNWPSERAATASDSLRLIVPDCARTSSRQESWLCMVAIDRRLSVIEEYGWPREVVGARNSIGQYIPLRRPPVNVSAPAPAAPAGVSFVVDPSSAQGATADVLGRLGLRVLHSGAHGRVDVIARPRRPTFRVHRVVVGQSLAQRGDYYLFDSTTFVLVRPATREYFRFRLSETSFNYEGRRDGWPWFRFGQLRLDTIADELAPPPQRSDFTTYWHLDVVRDSTCVAGDCSIGELARGRTIVADAPPSEAGIAQWFGAAVALARMPVGAESLAGKRIRLTAINQWVVGEGADGLTTIATLHPIAGLRGMAVAPADLRLPTGYRETPWPRNRR